MLFYIRLSFNKNLKPVVFCSKGLVACLDAISFRCCNNFRCYFVQCSDVILFNEMVAPESMSCMSLVTSLFVLGLNLLFFQLACRISGWQLMVWRRRRWRKLCKYMKREWSLAPEVSTLSSNWKDLSNSIFKCLEHIFECECFISIEKMHQSISQNLISDFCKGFETNFANCVGFMFIIIFS